MITKNLKRIVVLVPLLFAGLLIYSQSPQLISYQAIIRDNIGNPLTDSDISIKFSILQGSTTGPVVFTETHAAHTNAFGLVNLAIGSIGAGMNTIDWASGPYFLKVEADSKDMGTTQLLSVPYALYALAAGGGFTRWNDTLYYSRGNVGVGTKNPLSTLSVTGTTPNDSAIFEVKNNNGMTVFAVYNEGVRINIDETGKGAKGGFAIGGLSNVKTVARDYMRVTGDSIRLYINNTANVKGAKGGFAIGGFDKGKTPPSRYMTISSSEGTNTGFNTFLGYGSGNPLGGTHNVGIGYYAGTTLSSGSNNIMIGDSAGYYTSSGYENIFIGRSSGSRVYYGYNNVYIGYRAGSDGYGQYNVFIGDESGRYNNNGYNNAFVGAKSGKYVTDGSNNTFLGSSTGWKIASGDDNVFIGSAAGASAVNSNQNTFIGSFAGNANTNGNKNVYIGYQAGSMNSGNNNIFIGYNAGYQYSGQTNKLIIDGMLRNNIYEHFINGEMNSNYMLNKLRINGDMGIKTDGVSGVSLTVNGEVKATLFTTTSDARLKTDITGIADPVGKILSLNGVAFRWKNTEKDGNERHIGLIAQEVLDVIPEAVSTKGDYYSIEYAPITAILVEAVKQLKKENDDLKIKVGKIDDLEREIVELKAVISTLSKR